MHVAAHREGIMAGPYRPAQTALVYQYSCPEKEINKPGPRGLLCGRRPSGALSRHGGPVLRLRQPEDRTTAKRLCQDRGRLSAAQPQNPSRPIDGTAETGAGARGPVRSPRAPATSWGRCGPDQAGWSGRCWGLACGEICSDEQKTSLVPCQIAFDGLQGFLGDP